MRASGLPVGGPLTTEQEGLRALAALRGSGRVATVEVSASGLVLGGWLETGRHAGLVAEARIVVHPPGGAQPR